MSRPQLTAGVCTRLHDNPDPEDPLWTSCPTVQILSIKQVSSPTTTATVDRYRLIVSDGEHFLQSMLSTQLNYLVTGGDILKNTVIVLEKFNCNLVQDKRLLIILSLGVVAHLPEKIGSPGPLPQASTSAAADTPVSAQAVTPATASASTHQNARVAPQQQQAQSARSGRNQTIYPIEALSPYQNSWTIRARVTQKSDIRTFSNARGEGKLFSVTLMDDSSEIKATGFNATVDQFYDVFQEGKVYLISKARVNLAKKKFSNLSNEYELNLERNTEVEECRDTTNVPVVRYNFVELSALQDIAKDSICDVIGIVKEVADLSQITSKANKTLTKRELSIVDRSNFSVRLTLWGKQAEQYEAVDQPVIAFKGVKVGDFGGRSLSMLSSSTMSVNPDIPEAHALRGWYDGGGNASTFQPYTNSAAGFTGSAFKRAEVRSLHDIKESHAGLEDKVEYFSAEATVMHIKPENIAYPACPTPSCNKKLIEGHDGWRCEKCDKSFERPEYRYIISMAVADYSGQAWLQGFNDVGLALFNRSANEVIEIKERDEPQFSKIIESAIGTAFNFSCRAKADTWNDQVRVRYGVQKMLPLNYQEEGNYLKELLSSEWAQ